MDIKYYIDEHPGVPESVMKNMRERLGYDEDDESVDEEILAMSPKEFLDEWLNWNGFIGYVDFIIEAICMAYGVSLEDEPFDRDIKREIDRW